MIWSIVARAAELAERGEATVDAALTEYGKIENPQGCHEAQVWASVAFLCSRHSKLILTLDR